MVGTVVVASPVCKTWFALVGLTNNFHLMLLITAAEIDTCGRTLCEPGAPQAGVRALT